MIMRIFVLGLLALANASPIDFGIRMYGNYSVANCGTNTSRIINLLEKLSSVVQPAIEDANSSDPGAAYKAFFGDPTYAPFISTILGNVTTGVPMTPASMYSLDGGVLTKFNNGGVTFFCVTAPEQFRFTLGSPRDSYNDCMANPQTAITYIGFAPPKQYVVVCPTFFTSNIEPVPPPNTCLSVNRRLNRFRTTGQSFVLYQMWLLLAMIVHYYIFTSRGILEVTKSLDANSCVQLAANQSSLNEISYLYYAASIYGDCTDFPRTRDNGRGTLEVEVDLTDNSDYGLDFAGPATVEYIATDLYIEDNAITVPP